MARVKGASIESRFEESATFLQFIFVLLFFLDGGGFMLYDLDSDSQREQFANVIDHLLQAGNKKKEIALRIGLSPYDIDY